MPRAGDSAIAKRVVICSPPRTPNPRITMNKYIVEFIGTFFLVLTIGCNVLGGNAVAPLAIGLALAVMIFAGGHISGAHYNPAVTLAVTVRGKCSPADAVPYVIFQVIGAAAAAFTAKYLYADAAAKVAAAAAKAAPLATGPAFVAELLFTFALAWVVLNVATSKDTANNSFYGLAIGGTVLAGAFSVGSISGGAFNPAVAVGAALMGLIQWGNIWIHLVADLLGGLLAAIAFKSLSTADRE
jgi:aquaporin Z